MPHNITGTHVAKLYQEFTYNSNNAEVDVVTSATAGSCFESGFGYAYNKGERIDCTYLEKRLVEGGRK